MEKGLLKAISYLTKIDACARLVLPGDARTFGRGEIQKTKRSKPSKALSDTKAPSTKKHQPVTISIIADILTPFKVRQCTQRSSFQFKRINE